MYVHTSIYMYCIREFYIRTRIRTGINLIRFDSIRFDSIQSGPCGQRLFLKFYLANILSHLSRLQLFQSFNSSFYEVFAGLTFSSLSPFTRVEEERGEKLGRIEEGICAGNSDRSGRSSSISSGHRIWIGIIHVEGIGIITH